MIRRLIIEPEAEADINAAASWYERESPTLARSFLDAVDSVLNVIRRNPDQYQTIYRSLRRANIKRFPYGLMYQVTEREIMIVACMHGRRHPSRWQDRLRS